MSPRAHDYDLNDGGNVFVDGSDTLTKFGHGYNAETEMFATLVRVRNAGIEGFNVQPITTAATKLAMQTGGEVKAHFGDVSVHDTSIFHFLDGTISSGLVTAWDQSEIRIRYESGETPVIDGVATSITSGDQLLSNRFVHIVDFKVAGSLDEVSLKIVLHDTAFLNLEPF